MPAFHRKSRQCRSKTILPHLWLFTDERVADDILLNSIMRLPYGSGIVFRHYQSDRDRRHSLFKKVCAAAKQRGITVLLADSPHRAAKWQAGGCHLGSAAAARRSKPALIRSASAHNLREVARANRMGVDLLFLSPVFPTRSHPGGRALGSMRFAALARHARMPVIALGGMTASRFRRMKPLGTYGWAAIDALTG
ncbi:MAG: thiamine phosphate synthase [Sphingobium sp.]|nr:thiamine phosphate synthase [Sphingobium sp.]MCP5400636.1 thiamine phosphate synthase [Sphingomonas sp.]